MEGELGCNGFGSFGSQPRSKVGVQMQFVVGREMSVTCNPNGVQQKDTTRLMSVFVYFIYSFTNLYGAFNS